MHPRTLFFAAALIAVPATAAPWTPEVRTMVEKAVRSGDAAKRDAVVGVAKESYPESADEIDAYVASIESEMTAHKQEELANAGFFDNWTGQGEAGASIATGNSDTKNFAAGLKLAKEGLHWRHAITGSADYQRSEGETNQERFFVGYAANYKFSERLYALAGATWERNQVSGLKSRFTEMLGVGYKVIDRPTFRWAVEGGPALRQARFVDRDENTLAFRAASDIGWDITPTVLFTQNTAAIIQSGSDSIIAQTALTAKLLGALSARMSFNVQYESEPPLGDKKTDTVTRLTLVYDF